MGSGCNNTTATATANALASKPYDSGMREKLDTNSSHNTNESLGLIILFLHAYKEWF